MRALGDDMKSLVLSSRSSPLYHGDLDSVTDSEHRGLRPIGAAVRDVAGRTSVFLNKLSVRSAVHVFQGVRTVGRDGPSIPHVVITGNHIVFVESVTWPSGRYSIRNVDEVFCDEVYIGQSIRPLMTAVDEWRDILPAGHCVSALVVVHPIDDGAVILPESRARALNWAPPQSIAGDLCGLLPVDQPAISSVALQALVAASDSATKATT